MKKIIKESIPGIIFMVIIVVLAAILKWYVSITAIGFLAGIIVGFLAFALSIGVLNCFKVKENIICCVSFLLWILFILGTPVYFILNTTVIAGPY